ncbi:MAG: sulfatase-like hydrolase/transferase [Armatimonadota bacterium]|nr:sulfatase-like hydrolase/transferase [Armatimonadota bacterium]
MGICDNNDRFGRREAIKRIGSFVAGAAAAPMLSRMPWANADPPGGKPNVIVMVADDLGYGDVGCFGSPDISTPNLDAMAAQGVRFAQSYVAVSVCSPARASILTGKYPRRTSMPDLAVSNDPESGLSPSDVTLAEVLKKEGYATGAFGKWHLGYAPKFRPRKQGFDEFYGYLSGWADYETHSYSGSQGSNEKWMFKNDVQFDEPGYMTDLLAREARSFIDRHQSHPFFLYLPWNAPHGPHVAPDGTRAETRAVYQAIMSNFDYNIGQVLQKLTDYSIANNTFVIFISDNGADGVGSNYPLTGTKRTVYEGGVRTPFIAKWPAQITAGRVSQEPIISMDIFNTVAKACGAKIPAGAGVDGKDILNVMKGTASSPHEYLFFNFGNKYAVRRGKWKLIENTGLYDLDANPYETIDLRSSQPTINQELQYKLTQFKEDYGRRGGYSVDAG